MSHPAVHVRSVCARACPSALLAGHGWLTADAYTPADYYYYYDTVAPVLVTTTPGGRGERVRDRVWRKKPSAFIFKTVSRKKPEIACDLDIENGQTFGGETSQHSQHY